MWPGSAVSYIANWCVLRQLYQLHFRLHVPHIHKQLARGETGMIFKTEKHKVWSMFERSSFSIKY